MSQARVVQDALEKMYRAEEEARRLREQLQARREDAHQLMEAMPHGVLLLDSQSRLIFANQLACGYLADLAPGALEGEALVTLAGHEVDLCSQSMERHEFELPGSPPRIFELTCQDIQYDSRIAKGLVLCDVSQERGIQEQVEDQERLASIGQLAAGIAHDFNNMLTGIIGYAQMLLLEGNLLPTQQRDVQVILKQGERAAQLIRQILDFSRSSPIAKHPVDLYPFLREFVKMLRRTIPESIDIHLSLQDAPDGCLASVDPIQIQQVLMNLALNACDAMPKGGELTIQLGKCSADTSGCLHPDQLPPGDWAVLTVSDTGTGIPEEILQYIYEPFFTTKRTEGGTGLGLAQVYGIVRQHDGVIDVRSELGRGATFRVYLPVHTPQDQVTDVSRVPELPTGDGARVLVVEDEILVRNVTQKMLQGLGYEVQQASNGREALELYLRDPFRFALILTDIVMPEMGGIELYQRLRQLGTHAKVILMSGYPLTKEHRELCLDKKVGWAYKPLSREKLAYLVHEALAEPDLCA